MVGSWEVFVTDKMPQKVASAFNGLDLIGAEYEFIAYLGSQQVNGVNHAVLAKQTVVTGKDTDNIVLMIFNEKGMDCTLVNIERLVEGGPALGGMNIDVTMDIPDDALNAFNSMLADRVGANINPFALLGTKVTKGVNYLFAATLEPVVQNPVAEVVLVMVNAMTREMRIVNVLDSKLFNALGYAFTW